MTTYRLLIADNRKDFLEGRVELFENAGYQVGVAHNPQEVREQLYRNWYHLLILDVRLMDDYNEDDRSGLAIAHDLNRAIPIIMMTQFSRTDYVRDALRHTKYRQQPAVDYVEKKEGFDALEKAVQRALETYMLVDWQVHIKWREHLSFRHLVNSLCADVVDIAILEQRCHELEDLFRLLFAGNSQVTIGRLLSTYLHHVVLEGYVFGAENTAQQCLIACVYKGIGQTRKTLVHQPSAVWHADSESREIETIHFSARILPVTQGNLEDYMTLETYYRQQSVTSERGIYTCIEQLFSQTLAPVHHKKRLRQTGDSLFDLYQTQGRIQIDRISSDDIVQRIQAIQQWTLALRQPCGSVWIDGTDQPLTLHLPDGSSQQYRDLSLLMKPRELNRLRQSTGSAATLCGFVCAFLSTETVLVNQHTLQIYLVDGAGVRDDSPLFWDFIALEQEVKFHLLGTTDLYARHMLEQCLARLPQLAVTPSNEQQYGDEQIQKALAMIGAIRQQAARLIGATPADYQAYQLGLLVYSLAHLLTSDPTHHYSTSRVLSYAHSLLSAAILYASLIPDLPPPEIPDQARTGFWIDTESHTAWLKEHPLDLSVQEFDLLLYLHQHANHVCTRQAIICNVMGGDPSLSDKSLEDTYGNALNAAMHRLRRKLSAVRHPVITIQTQHGVGFKLITSSNRAEWPS